MSKRRVDGIGLMVGSSMVGLVRGEYFLARHRGRAHENVINQFINQFHQSNSFFPSHTCLRPVYSDMKTSM
jgi:hypothetical protein